MSILNLDTYFRCHMSYLTSALFALAAVRSFDKDQVVGGAPVAGSTQSVFGVIMNCLWQLTK